MKKNHGNNYTITNISNHMTHIEYIFLALCCFPVVMSYIWLLWDVDEWIVISVSMFIVISLFLVFNFKYKICKYNFDDIDIIGFMFIIVLTLLQITRGDSAGWDTLNYHIYAGESFSRNFVIYDFFPGRAINSMYWVLGDQIPYLIRKILGFRLGTISASVAMFASYMVIKRLIARVCKSECIDVDSVVYGMAAIIVLLTENILWSINCYYIDIYALPILLLLVEIVLFPSGSNLEFILIGIMIGICTSIKVSNLFFLLPLAIVYLLRKHNVINAKSILLCVVVASCIIAPYIIRSIIVTGNPLFPYLNSWFKSVYFSTEQGVNEIAQFNKRFGPESLLEYIFWPIYCMFNKYRIVDSGVYSGRLLINAAAWICVFFTKKKEYSVESKWLFGVASLLYFCYLIFADGYIRYGFVVETTGTIVLIVFVLKQITISNSGVLRLFALLLSIMLVTQGTICTYEYVKTSNGMNGWGNLVTDYNGYISNAKYLLKDRQSGIDEEVLNDIDVWILSYYNSAYSTLIKKDIPIINIIKQYSRTNDYSQKIYRDLLEKHKRDNMYTLANMYTIDEQMRILSDEGFKITEIKNIAPNFMDANIGLYLIKVEYTGGSENNVVNTCYYYNADEITVKISQDSLKGKLLIGVDAGERKFEKGIDCKVSLCNLVDRMDENCCIGNIDYASGYIQVEYNIDESNWCEDTCFHVVLSDDSIYKRVVLSATND